MKISQYIFSVLLCQVLLVSSYAQNCSKTVNVFFDFDKDNVKVQYEDELLAEIDAIGVDNITSIEISGHTDSKGSIEYNIDLANRRNKNVKEILPKTLLNILKENAHGELKPFEGATYEDDKRFQNNRRVEVLIKYECGGTNIENTPQSIALREKDQQQLDAFLASNEPITEVITFDNKEDQLLKTDQGTTLFVPANSFINSDGTVPEEVTIEVKEYYDFLSIVSSNLTTLTNSGDHLETAGMIHLSSVDQNRNTLQLANPISIGIPRSDEENKKSGMELYEGTETDNGVQWSLNSNGTKTFYRDTIYMDPEKYATYFDSTKLDSEQMQYCKAFAEKKILLTGQDILLVGPYTKVITPGQELELEKRKQNNELGDYFLNVTKMGYINCDRSALKGYGGKDIQVSIQRHKSFNGVEMTYLVFDQITSFADPDRSSVMNTMATFSRIPEGLDVTLISLIVSNGEMYFAKETFQTSTELIQPKYSKITEEEFKLQVEGLIKL